MKYIPVFVAQKMADKYQKDIVLIVGWDNSNKINIVTWGREPAQKAVAAKAGDAIAKQLGLADDLADVYEDYRREGEAAAEVDRLRRLAVELWGSRRNMAYDPAGEAAILAEFPFLRELIHLERAKLEIAEL